MGDVMHAHRRKAGLNINLERESILSCFKLDFRQRKPPGVDDDSWINSLLYSLDNIAAESPEYAPDDDVFLQGDQDVTIDFYSVFHKSPSTEFKWQPPIRARKPSNGCLKSPTQGSLTSPKKHVKFADDVGLSLEVPMKDVLGDEHCAFQSFSLPEEKNCYVQPQIKYALYPCFDQPGSAVDFLERTLEQKVCLENAMVCDELTIHGTIRVADIGENKNIKVRFTTNNWQRYYDLPAGRPEVECDGPTARFTFRIVAPEKLSVGDKLEFAVVFETEGQVYWDNNNQQNYVFECKVYVDSGRFQVSTS